MASEDGGRHRARLQVPGAGGPLSLRVVPEGVRASAATFRASLTSRPCQVEPYKQALTFLGKGALLSLSGDKKVGFLVRDVDHVEVEIGRVLPNQLQHIAPQMWDFAQAPMYAETWKTSRGALQDGARLQRTSSRASRPTTASIWAQYLQRQGAEARAGCSCCASAR